MHQVYKVVFLYSALLGRFIIPARAQGLDSLLASIEQNNKALQANESYWEAQKARYRTGLAPYDLQVEFDYLPGSPAGAGTQRDFAVTQRMDFPSVYKRKRELSALQREGADWQHLSFRQDVVAAAKGTALELISLNKKAAVLEGRRQQTARLVEDYQKKLDKGEAIILDVNKARLQLLHIENETALNLSERQALLARLTEWNGGIPVEWRDTVYPALPQIPDFETLDSLIEAHDPLIRAYDQEKQVQRQQVAVQKALNLPKIEAGYHSQGILGQSYRGVHAGITVPLWENKNRLRAAELSRDHADANAQAHRLEHRMENKRLYDQLAVRAKAMQEYTALVATLNNAYLLEKAMRLGQITMIQYFQEESYYFSAYDKYLQLELEYHRAVAQLFRYRL